MSFRVRIGSASISSRGRVGASVGPFSASTGPRRSGGGGGCFAEFLVIGVIMIAVMWPLSLWGHAIHLTPSWHQLMHHDKAWLHRHYPMVGLRYVGAFVALGTAVAAIVVAVQAALAPRRERALQQEREMLAERAKVLASEHQEWLNGPPPPFQPPGRFTQSWLEDNVPHLHPGQIPMLVAELRARGWKEDRIAQRVEPLVPHRRQTT
jgi:hypothetical protein